MAYIYALLMLGSWLVPMHILPWVGWQQEVLAFCAVLALGWHALILARESGKLVIPRAAALLVAGAAIIGAQWIGHQITFGGDALVLGFYLVLIAVCFCVGFSLSAKVDTTTALDGLALTLLVGAIFSAVIALSQAFDVWETLPVINRSESLRRPGGNLGQPNHLATLLLMGVASLVYLYESRKCGATLASLLFAILICGLVLTESRTGLLSFFLMTSWWLVRRHSVAFKASPLVALLGCASLLIFLWAWPPFLAFVQAGGDVDGRLTQRLDLSAGIRPIVWMQLGEAVLQRPWFGWGLREVSEAHNAVLHSYSQGDPFTYAHNILLDLAVGIGLPLTTVLVLVVTVWGWRRVRNAKTILPWYSIAIILPLAVHSLLEFPFAYAYLLAPAMLVIGVLEGTLAPMRVFKVSWWAVAMGLFLATATMIWSAAEYVEIEEDFRVARFEAMHIGETPSDYERPKIILLSQLDALMNGARIVPAPSMSLQRIELARKVAMRYPWTATQNRYALSLALNGNSEEAIRQLKVMRAMHGEKTYREIKANWNDLAQGKYPQLLELKLP